MMGVSLKQISIESNSNLDQKVICLRKIETVPQKRELIDTHCCVHQSTTTDYCKAFAALFNDQFPIKVPILEISAAIVMQVTISK